jgi:LuxR family maltose regulon positive regulatory protein
MKKTQQSSERLPRPYPLLKTKIAIPQHRIDLVNRPRLIQKLNDGVKGKLTLLSAPAGFGKTTLLGEWVHQCRCPVAWFSVDKGDNDPAYFLTYTIAALQTIEESIGQTALQLLYTPQLPPFETIVVALINSLTLFAKDFVLVLDDYHHIESKPINDILVFLLENLPERMHLVLATRSDPSLSLSRLRSQQELTEIRAADLYFTTDETSLYLQKCMQINLSHEEIALLESRTEGWITGLQLAALSMKDRNDLSRFITDFTGDNRYIVDYLMEEVLNRQPEHIQTFLLATSILDPISASLCDAVIGKKNSQQMLDLLEQENLFIFSLDEKRNWFRYHKLFADSLRQRLYQLNRDQVPEFHKRACDWYDQNGLKYEGIEHALAAQDFERAVYLLEEIAESVWDRGQQVKLVEWFDSLPRGILSSRPLLCVLHARALVMSGQQKKAEKCLLAAEQILKSPSNEVIEILPDGTSYQHVFDREKLQGKISAVWALMSMYKGDVPHVIQYSQEALSMLPQEDLTWRGVATTTLGMAHGWAGDGNMKKAEQAFSDAISISLRANNISFYLFAGLALAGIQTYQGRMGEAEDLCRRLLQKAEEYGMSQTGNVASILSILGGILCEKNDFERGLPYLKKGLELARLSHDLIALQGIRLNMLRVLILKKDLSEAIQMIHQIEKDAQKFHLPPWMIHTVSAYKAQIWLLSGKLDSALQLVKERGLGINNKLISRMEPEYVILARVLIAQNKPGEADVLLQRLIKNAMAGDRIVVAIQMHLVRILSLSALGHQDAAVGELKKALALAEPGGFINIFVFEGQTVEALLEKIQPERKNPYVRRIMMAFKSSKSSKREGVLIEPLSERELDVLQLLSTGLSNQEIADRLYISLNTVRTHTKNINSKLNVHSRTQAVAKSKELGII